MKMRMMFVLGVLSMVVACGEGNTEIVNRLHSLVDLQEATTAQCPDGGMVVLTGVDTNENDLLDAEEVTRTRVLCDGSDGADGQTTLLRADPEPAGEHCGEGGFKINHGLDDNGNGALEDEEIDGFEYICNGLPGTGVNSLVSVMEEAPGVNCPAGGQAIRSGLDLDGDHLLQPTEVDATVYVCHGGDGTTSLIRREDEPAGVNCPFGGQAVMTGLDGDGNGYLDDMEVQATYYVCHGADGADGVDGVNNLFETTVEPAGPTCPAGGVWVISGPDLNRNGALDADEIQVEEVICHGADGIDGTDGTDGIDGSSNLLRATNAAWAGVCAFGGVKLETGVDLNANGVLDDAEVTTTQYVCNRSISSFSAIATGQSSTCGILTGGALVCWGDNGFGKLGDGTAIDRYTPVPVSGMGSGVAQVAVGTDHACAVKTDGSAWCWGSNAYGQLGDGTYTIRYAPTAVSGLATGVSKLATFRYHNCAVKLDGSAWCWGNNATGQLGDGTTTTRNTPVAVSGMASGAAQMTAGGTHSCAVKTDGSAWCWGSNANGQLGNGTTTSSTTPVAVSTMASAVTMISAGFAHTCAVKTDGSAWCWGSNVSGQLGDGTTISSTTPMAVISMASGVTQLVAGYNHVCVRKSGAVWCWGWNFNGQLGDGTNTQRTSPVAVLGFDFGVTQIAAGGSQSCAIRTNGSAWCWGSNSNGQLGDGSLTNRTLPVMVTFGELSP